MEVKKRKGPTEDLVAPGSEEREGVWCRHVKM